MHEPPWTLSKEPPPDWVGTGQPGDAPPRRLLRLTREGVVEVPDRVVAGTGGGPPTILAMTDDEKEVLQEVVGDRMAKLIETYDEGKELVERYQAGVATLERLEELDRLAREWSKDPENLAKGIDWARKTGDLIGGLTPFIPDLPAPVKAYVEGLLQAVPRYVEVMTGQLKDHIAAIDTAAEEAEGTVKLGSASCSGGRIDGRGVQVLKGLDVDDGLRSEIFRSACHSGLETALSKHLGF